MNKIVEKGDKLYTCDICGCKFTVDKDNIKWNDVAIDYDRLTNRLRDCISTRCPQCGNRIIVDWY